jgi:hypothetical protein
MEQEYILEGINKILTFLGKHGGRIRIASDWDFCCRVNDLGEGEFELELSSLDESEGEVFTDPFFRVGVTFDEQRQRILTARPTEYVSRGWMHEIRMDESGNYKDSAGKVISDEDALSERLAEYLATVTRLRPYLRDPLQVICFQKDADRSLPDTDPERRKQKREAMARMGLLGICPEDIEAYRTGELTKILVEHANRKVRREALTVEEKTMIQRVEKESRIPFLTYYVITDTLTWPDGATNTRYILPYVWDEKHDSSTEDEKAGKGWAGVRKEMLQYGVIPAYVINANIPSYCEFAQVPYRLVNGMLFAIG